MTTKQETDTQDKVNTGCSHWIEAIGIIAIIVIAVIVVLALIGSSVGNIFSNIGYSNMGGAL